MTQLLNFIFSPLTKRFRLYKYGRISTFTYFIPAPPTRNSGYREKNFDVIVGKLVDHGFDILDFKAQSISNEHSSGTLIILKVQAYSKEAQNLNPSLFPSDSLSSLDNEIDLTAPSQAERQ